MRDEMIHQARRIIPQNLYSRLRPVYERLSRYGDRLAQKVDRRTIPESRFAEILQELGIISGAVAMVHSSMDAITRRVPSMDPMKLIRLLQQHLGEEGTLLMPTFPFTGRQLDYVENNDVFDARKTPSQMGLMTEVFRRMPGVRRSLHPTHSIAGWGRHAEELLSEHHFGTAFGERSPIFKLQAFGGVVVSLGVAFADSFTILHVPEEMHPKTREHAYEKKNRAMTILKGSEEIRFEIRVLKGNIQRNFRRVEKALLRSGAMKRLDEKGLRCLTARAEEFIGLCNGLIDRDMYLF